MLGRRAYANKVNQIFIGNFDDFTSGSVQGDDRAPVGRFTIQLTGSPRDLVCQVKRFSADQALTFHYGTYPSQEGTHLTFRLIGVGHELELFNPEGGTSYHLRLYLAKDGSEKLARKSYKNLKDALVGNPIIGCG